MRRLEYFMSFWEFSNERAIELAERLVKISPDSLTHVYFTNGGSEGNEAAIKMARYFHHRRGEGERTWILAREQAYHGIGYGSGSATGFDIYHEGFGPMLPHVRHLTPPWPYRAELFDGEDPTDFCLRELEQTIEEIGPGKIAAMIGEPIMGVAGMIVPPDDYWPRVRELLTSHGILLILDEVVTAYGRTGNWFAAQHFGIEPDIVVTAKGITSGYMPLGAVLLSDAIATALGEDHGFPMGYTYNGHPTSCAVAMANLDIIEREGLLGRAKATGDLLLDRLRGLTDLEIVGEVRGVGMMLAVELVSDRETREPLLVEPPVEDVVRFDTGVIVRNCGHNVVLSPPLSMTDDEANEVADGLESVLRRLRPDGTYAAA
jgi:putrescine aminotransferase